MHHDIVDAATQHRRRQMPCVYYMRITIGWGHRIPNRCCLRSVTMLRFFVSRCASTLYVLNLFIFLAIRLVRRNSDGRLAVTPIDLTATLASKVYNEQTSTSTPSLRVFSPIAVAHAKTRAVGMCRVPELEGTSEVHSGGVP